MEKSKLNNFAYIDGANLSNGIAGFGWKLDYVRFKVWLTYLQTQKEKAPNKDKTL